MYDIEATSQKNKHIDHEKNRLFSYKIKSQINFRSSIVQLILSPVGSKINYKSGQYIKILGKDGEMYAFSIANPPSDNYEIILYIRCYKGNYDLTKFYSCLNDYIFISGPYGRCIYNPSSFRLPIFIAQGIGITAFQAFFQQYKIKGELIWLKKKTDLSFHRNIIEIYKKKNNDFSVHYFFSDIEYDSINFLDKYVDNYAFNKSIDIYLSGSEELKNKLISLTASDNVNLLYDL